MTMRAEQGLAPLTDEIIARVASDARAALRRKPAQEARLAGALRELAACSPSLAETAFEIGDTLVKRGSFQRPLYGAVCRVLPSLDDAAAAEVIERALSTDDAGGLATLSAACFVRDPRLSASLARVATNRHPHLAFGAEVARVARGESSGEHVASVAPKIKESHRIELCAELFVPLLWTRPMPPQIAPALSVLRGAERHLGRWLVLAEIAARAGDSKPAAEARERAGTGPPSARSAWAMVCWALEAPSSPPSLRPTVEIVARLSDRPSADRDMTFLIRLARARVGGAKTMLENAAKGGTLADETGVRAALYLISNYSRGDLRRPLVETAKSSRREPLRGLAAAALYDIGDLDTSLEIARDCLRSRHLQTAAWSALILAAGDRAESELVSEPRFRRIQLGWVE